MLGLFAYPVTLEGHMQNLWVIYGFLLLPFSLTCMYCIIIFIIIIIIIINIVIIIIIIIITIIIIVVVVYYVDVFL